MSQYAMLVQQQLKLRRAEVACQDRGQFATARALFARQMAIAEYLNKVSK